ncbi:MAG: hypothetical protein K8T10_10465 [Candidatus Eremiobacteraeota bacterium]|nr:hypothetical protein [Candidatus Eremiobacteraeota bacterium]
MSLKSKNSLWLRKGLTLVEMIITLGMMIVFIGALFSAMIAGLTYWKDGRLRLQTQEALRESLDTMTTELRQALPNPDPGTNGNPPTGYLGITPEIDPSGILYPNENNSVGDYLEFTEPVVSVYIPSTTGWSEEQPDNYQKIRYYVNKEYLIRRVTRYNSSGVQVSEEDNNVVALREGEITMQVTSLSTSLVEIEMTATLSKFSYTIKTKVKIGG